MPHKRLKNFGIFLSFSVLSDFSFSLTFHRKDLEQTAIANDQQALISTTSFESTTLAVIPSVRTLVSVQDVFTNPPNGQLYSTKPNPEFKKVKCCSRGKPNNDCTFGQCRKCCSATNERCRVASHNKAKSNVEAAAPDKIVLAINFAIEKGLKIYITYDGGTNVGAERLFNLNSGKTTSPSSQLVSKVTWTKLIYFQR